MEEITIRPEMIKLLVDHARKAGEKLSDVREVTVRRYHRDESDVVTVYLGVWFYDGRTETIAMDERDKR